MDEDKDIKIVKQGAKKTRSLSPMEEVERLFDNYFPKSWRGSRWNFPSWEDLETRFSRSGPKIDLVERDTEIIIRAEMPGIKKKDIELTLTDESVTLRGEYAKKEEVKEDDYYRSEMSSGSFQRTISLPANVDSESARAKLKDGVLELTLPKLEKTNRRKIEID